MTHCSLLRHSGLAIIVLGVALAGFLTAGGFELARAAGVEGAKQTPPDADYGDAPDMSDGDYAAGGGVPGPGSGQFPTLYDTDNTVAGRRGPYHLDTGLEMLGRAVDTETDANVTDLDLFDEGFRGFFFLAVQIPVPAWARWEVTIDNAAPAVSRYLNMAIDLNQDGRWGTGGGVLGAPEHVVQDAPVDVPPGQSQIRNFGPFAYGTGILFAYPAWVRGTLTRSPIDLTGLPGEWDGSGPDEGFQYGETEDHFFRLGGRPRDDDDDNGDPPDPPDPPECDKEDVYVGWMPRRVIVPVEGGTYFWIQICNPCPEDQQIDLSWIIQQVNPNSAVGLEAQDGTQIPPAPSVQINVPGGRCIWYRFCAFWLQGREPSDPPRRAIGKPVIDPPFVTEIEFIEREDSFENFSFNTSGQMTSFGGAALTFMFPIDFNGFFDPAQVSPPDFALMEPETIVSPEAVSGQAVEKSSPPRVLYAVDLIPGGPDPFDPAALLEMPLDVPGIEEIGGDHTQAFPVLYDPDTATWRPTEPFPSDGENPDEQPFVRTGTTVALEVMDFGLYGIAAPVTPPAIGLDPTQLTLRAAGEVYDVYVSNTGRGVLDWDLSVIDGGDWLSAERLAKNSDGGYFRVEAAVNDSGAARQGLIRVTAPEASNDPVDLPVLQIPFADIDSDGAVTATDVQLVINDVLGIPIGARSGDINCDGVVNALDIQLVINVALGIDIGVPPNCV